MNINKWHIAIALFCFIFLIGVVLEQEPQAFKPALDEFGVCIDNYIANSPISRSKTPVGTKTWHQFQHQSNYACQSEMQKVFKAAKYSEKSKRKIFKLLNEKWDKAEQNVQLVPDKCY